MTSRLMMLFAVLAGVGLAFGGAWSSAAKASNPQGKAQTATRPVHGKSDLRIRNNTPFVITIYVAGVRAGWLRPFRTERFQGLKPGQHRLFASSQYGTATWGPTNILVPGAWNLAVNPETNLPDMDAALASRIFRSNKSSLQACDRLAERRGEHLKGGRAEFNIKVSAEGKGVVSVTSEDLGDKLLSCYHAVAQQWSFPHTGSAYQVSFMHMH